MQNNYDTIATKSQTKKWSAIYPWLVWLLGASFFFYKYLVQVSPSVMTNDLMQAFQINGAGLGNLSACYFYAYLIMQIPVGILLDKFSPRYLTAFAILICGVSTFIFANATSLGLACLARAAMGLGAAFAAVSCFKSATLWFSPQRFALISGMCMTAAMLGAVFGQAPLSFLVHDFGWRTALEIVGAVGILLSLLYFAIVRDKSIASNSSAPFEKGGKHLASFQPLKNLWLILKNKQAWLLSWYSGLAFAPVSVFGGLWGVPFLQQTHHLSAPIAAYAVSWIFIGFAVGAPLLGWMSDFIGRRKPIMIFGTLLALFSLLIVLYYPHQDIKQLIVLLFCFGLGASGFFTCFAMIREVFPILLAATVLGFMNTFDSICEALSEPLVGWVLDLNWSGAIVQGVHQFSIHSYQIALSLMPVYLAVSLLLLIFIEETYCQMNHA